MDRNMNDLIIEKPFFSESPMFLHDLHRLCQS